MTQNIFRIQIELLIENISCPAVRLESTGQIQFKVHALDSTVHSAHYPAYFPVLAKENFIFQQDFVEQKQLADIQYCLGKQFIFIELVQWLNECRPQLLAMFKSTLLDLLYPVFKDKDLHARSQLDLLMVPFKTFPSCLAPKIQATTKFRIETVTVPVCYNCRNFEHGVNYKLMATNDNSNIPKIQHSDVCEKFQNRCLRKTIISHRLADDAVAVPCSKLTVDARLEDLRKLNATAAHKSRLFDELSKFNVADLEHYLNETKLKVVVFVDVRGSVMRRATVTTPLVEAVTAASTELEPLFVTVVAVGNETDIEQNVSSSSGGGGGSSTNEIYDQRQNGTENYQVNIQNFLVLISSLSPQKLFTNFLQDYDLFKKRNSIHVN